MLDGGVNLSTLGQVSRLLRYSVCVRWQISACAAVPLTYVHNNRVLEPALVVCLCGFLSLDDIKRVMWSKVWNT